MTRDPHQAGGPEARPEARQDSPGRTWPEGSVVALSGGVGGARLVDGLAAVLPAEALTVIVNTGDDFVHWGLTICPDLDTIVYTLSGLADSERGWGLAGETFGALAMIARYGEASWFALGDRDLAMHIVRSQALARGEPLSQVTARLSRALGVGPRVLPMTDESYPTFIDTVERGVLPFQEWLVRERTGPTVRAVRLGGPEARNPARPGPDVLAAIGAAELVIIGPSNPFVSIDPILSLPGVRDAVARKPVVAVSPIVAGQAVKGPLAGMIQALEGRAPSAAAVVAHYREQYGDILDAVVVERGDEVAGWDLAVLATGTIMKGRADRARLAGETLALGETLS